MEDRITKRTGGSGAVTTTLIDSIEKSSHPVKVSMKNTTYFASALGEGGGKLKELLKTD